MRIKSGHVCVFALAVATCLWARPPKPRPTPAPPFEVPGPTKGVEAVAFSADGRTILAVGFDRPVYLTLTLWDIATGKSRRTLTGPAETQLYANTFSPDARTLATGTGPGPNEGAYTYWVTLWDVATGKTLHKMAGHEDAILSAAFTPDGRTLVTGSQDETLHVWNVSTGQQLYARTVEGCAFDDVAINPDGHTFADVCNAGQSYSGAPEGTLITELRDATNGNVLRTLPPRPSTFGAMAYTPDGRALILPTSDTTLTMWDLSTGAVIRTLSSAPATAAASAPAASASTNSTSTDSTFIGDIVFSTDGKTLAAGIEPNTIDLWDVASGQLLRTLSGHTDSVTGVAFSADGKTLVSGSDDNTIKLWDVATGKLLKSLGTVNPPSADGPQP